MSLLDIFIENRANVKKCIFVLIMWIVSVSDELMIAVEGNLG